MRPGPSHIYFDRRAEAMVIIRPSHVIALDAWPGIRCRSRSQLDPVWQECRGWVDLESWRVSARGDTHLGHDEDIRFPPEGQLLLVFDRADREDRKKACFEYVSRIPMQHRMATALFAPGPFPIERNSQIGQYEVLRLFSRVPETLRLMEEAPALLLCLAELQQFRSVKDERRAIRRLLTQKVENLLAYLGFPRDALPILARLPFGRIHDIRTMTALRAALGNVAIKEALTDLPTLTMSHLQLVTNSGLVRHLTPAFLSSLPDVTDVAPIFLVRGLKLLWLAADRRESDLLLETWEQATELRKKLLAQHRLRRSRRLSRWKHLGLAWQGPIEDDQ